MWGGRFRLHRPGTLVCLLVALASARIVSTYKPLSHTTDEPAHLAAGMQYLETGKYLYEDQHPPLARVLGAAGLYLTGARFGNNPDMYVEGYHLLGYGHRYRRNLFYSRLAMLPLFWIAAAVVYRWTRRAAGPRSALFAILIFTSTPVALSASIEFASAPSLTRAVMLGVWIALAILSKFSALVFLPAAWGAIAITRLSCTRKLLRTLPYAPLIAATAALLIWAAYSFRFGQVDYLHTALPAPAFFTGLRSVWLHNQIGHPSFLLGRLSKTGFWYYYPVVLVFKTPIALLILLAWGAARRKSRYLPALAAAIAIVLAAMPGHINIGVRHILPVYMLLAICAGIAAADLTSRRGPIAALAAVLLAWNVVCGFVPHPDYISYTNEFAGMHPENILADSDLDWEQGLGRLDLRLREIHAERFAFKSNTTGYMIAGNPFLPYTEMPDGDIPPHGWCAVAITPWRIFNQPHWPAHAIPRERIAHSILLYWFP
jgi:hypothetical protein